MVRLIDESRRCEAAAERSQDEPAGEGPTAARELLESAHCNSMLVDLQALADPDALALAQEEAEPDLVPTTFWWAPEVEPATATPEHAAMTALAMPPTAARAQIIATGDPRGPRRIASMGLYLGVLVVLCLGVLVFLGLDTGV